MIYLIDEQTNRQNTYSWGQEKFSKYDSILNVFSATETLSFDKIKAEAKIVFLHESFPDEELKRALYQYNEEEKSFGLVVFSGSKNERKQRKNRVDIPVKVFYQNLEIFLEKNKQEGKPKIEYLLYGDSNIEKELLKEIEFSIQNERADSIQSQKDNFIFFSDENAIESPFDNIKRELDLYADENDEFSDSHIDSVLRDNLLEEKYDNIYIPLCFGKTLSDFNGLRLATHIRCTSTKNQLTTIFIYGVPSLDRLMNNPYFDILKTKNVFYIGYNKKALQEAENKAVEVFSEDELSTELKKVNLEAPKDNHSIANEWAIYRWAKSVQADDYDIEKINQKIESNLYYKYLQTIYPVSESKDLQSIKVKFANERPRVLYIDDEYEKGWNEIFATILYDKSEKIDFESLETDFSASQERIIENAVQKIKEKDIDTVILDFRLHKNDFSNQNTNEITSVKLLQEIKRINAGIQVIFFSATNKIWNLQKLQEFGADGFIIKESPENSINPHFTQETICNFKATMETAFKRRFLKEIFKKIQEIRKFANSLFSENREIKNEINSFLDIAFELLYRESLSFAYLQLFLVIELFAKHLLENDNLLGNDNDVIYIDDVCVRKDNEQSITFKNGKYVIGKQKLNGNPKKVDTNFKVASLLIYRYGFENSSALKWTDIYTNRNQKVSHYSNADEQKIGIKDVQQILDFLFYILNKDNLKDTNKDKGLKVDLKKQIENLAEHYKKR